LTSRTGTSFEERVGQVLVEAGFITDDQLGQARAYGDEKGGSLLDNLMTLGIVGRYDRKWCTERMKEVSYPAG